MAANTLEQMVHAKMDGSSPSLASALANYVSPASTDKYEGMPDSKSLEVTCFKDSTKYQFGSGLAFPGYDQLSPDPLNGKVPAQSANMDVGTTWSLIVLLQPVLSAAGFWRMEWTQGGLPYVAVGVLPTANAIIRGTVNYVATVAAESTTARPIYLGLVSDQPTSAESPTPIGALAGRYRAPAVSCTTHLDAPALADQGMTASSLIGQSFAVNGNARGINVTGLGALSTPDLHPVHQWAGPKLGRVTNATSIVQTMANDPTRFVEKPLKVDGSYDIARSATLDWVQGIRGIVENPLYTGYIHALDPAGVTDIELPYTISGVPDSNTAPMLMANTNLSQQASLNLRMHTLLEIEPEIGSAFMPFRGLTPHTTKITEYFKRFAEVAAGAAHTFPASANDDGLLADAVKNVLKDSGPVPSEKPTLKGKKGLIQSGIQGATQVATAYFDPTSVQFRNGRKAVVRTNKQDNKTARYVAKQQGKTARKAARRG